ncbi:MAG: endonuclease/exonuclease/phosphatase family protein [Bacteroidales bacterium]|jgi:endonuclease/exonuclease/phosphatase family metal-dependent hydrolase|nr:endonuclease/exonuclease/phosphatase family protein [Bacteroidales bacterium]
MKKIVFLLITLWCISLHAQELTVASYNIRNDNKGDAQKGNGWVQRCPVICQLVRFHNFDIFGAQEVFDHQLKEMLELLPEYGYIGVGRDDGATKGEYAPIFYNKEKLKLLRSGNFWLSTITDRPNKGWDAALPRICTWGEFKTGKTKFWFFNLHMDHIGVEARKESAKLVLSRIREMCGKDPVILTGDFNVDQHNESYALLNNSDILDDSYEKSPIKYALNGTFNGFNPNMKTDSRIDHIFVSPSIKIARYGVLTDSYRSEIDNSHVEIKSGNFPKEVSLHEYVARVPSDHFPIMVQLRFK